MANMNNMYLDNRSFNNPPSRPIAPDVRVPERGRTYFETKDAANPSRRGPLLFEEGIATDTDVPNDFELGVRNGYVTAPGRPNHNAVTWIQPAEKTMQQRAHVGSSAWIQAPTFLGEFVEGVRVNQNSARQFVQVQRGEGLGRKYVRDAIYRVG